MNFSMPHLVHAVTWNDEEWLRESRYFCAYRDVARAVYVGQVECFSSALRALSSRGVVGAGLKGVAFLSDVYRGEAYYVMNDVDILVRLDQVETARAALSDCGLSQEFVSNDGIIEVVSPEVKASFETGHYELFPFTKIVELPNLEQHHTFIREHLPGHPFVWEGDRLFLACEVDLHHGLSGGIEEEDIWHGTRRIRIGDQDVMVVGNDVLAWFLAARFYHETMVLAKRSGKLLCDLAFLLSRTVIDYQYVLSIAHKYQITASLYYVYRFLREWAGLPIPAEFVAALAETQGPLAYHDWGDFIPKLAGVRLISEIKCE